MLYWLKPQYLQIKSFLLLLSGIKAEEYTFQQQCRLFDFYTPEIENGGVGVACVISLSICNFNLGSNFWTKQGRDFILGKLKGQGQRYAIGKGQG